MAEEVKEKKPNAVLACMSGFGRFLYNPDDHTVFGRGGASWAKIIFFYLIFYSCLAGFFSVCLHVMLMTIPEDKPTVIGRTNKPYVAISSPDLYTLDFKDDYNWEVFTNATKNLKKAYEDQNKENKNLTGNWKWTATGLDECSNPETFVQAKKESGKAPQACFYMGLNRVIDWNPADVLKDGEEMKFACEWDIGKSGKGNLTPPFTKKMINVPDYKQYYPWKSLSKSGLQPLAALYVVMDVDASKKVESKNLETWIKCSAMAGEEVLPKSRSAIFRIKYTNSQQE
jgi:hypothetical protein